MVRSSTGTSAKVLTGTKRKFAKVLKKILIRDDLIRNWYESIQNQSKNPICRTYSVFKFVFQMEPYLKHISNYKLRRSLTQLRTSSHALGVESSRHKRKDDPSKSSSLCAQCNVLEDEAHFVLHCPRLALERQHLFGQ